MSFSKIIYIPNQIEENIIHLFNKSEIKHYTDTYFDSPDYELTQKNFWLRKRNNSFNLIIIKNLPNNFIEYQRIDDEQEIQKLLNLQFLDNNFENNLLLNNILPFANFHLQETIWQKDNLILKKQEFDFDSDFEYQSYVLKTDNNTQALQNFLTQNNIQDEKLYPGIIAYLQEKKSQHFQKLLEAEIIS